MRYGVLEGDDVNNMSLLLNIISNVFDSHIINIVEVGVFQGKTSLGIIDYLNSKGKETKYYGVEKNWNNVDKSIFSEVIEGDSAECYFLVPSNIHFIFVDGCHCKNHVVLDFLNYSSKLVQNGIIAFHDSAITKSFIDYQYHGPKDCEDFYISVRKALESIGLLSGMWPKWKLILDKPSGGIGGGITAFQKVGD